MAAYGLIFLILLISCIVQLAQPRTTSSSRQLSNVHGLEYYAIPSQPYAAAAQAQPLQYVPPPPSAPMVDVTSNVMPSAPLCPHAGISSQAFSSAPLTGEGNIPSYGATAPPSYETAIAATNVTHYPLTLDKPPDESKT